MPCDRGHLRAMRLLPFAAAIVLMLKRQGLRYCRARATFYAWHHGEQHRCRPEPRYRPRSNSVAGYLPRLGVCTP